MERQGTWRQRRSRLHAGHRRRPSMVEGAPLARSGRPFARLPPLQESGAALALAALFIFNLLFTHGFLTLQTLNVNLTQVAPTVIVAVGMALVVGTGGI